MKYIIALLLAALCGLAQAQCANTDYGHGVTCVTASGVGGSSTNQSSKSLGVTPTAGHQLIVGAYQCWDASCATTGTTTMTISSNLANPEPCFTASPSSPFTLVETGPDAQHLQQYIWYCSNVPSGVTAITINCSIAASCNYMTLWIAEWTGLTTTTGSGAFDGDGGNASTASTTTMSCTTSSGAYINDLIVSVGDNTEDNSTTATSPALQVNQFFGGNIMMAYTSGSTGTHNLQGTWTGADDYYISCAAIKSATSTGGGPTNLRGVPGVENEYLKRYWAFVDSFH